MASRNQNDLKNLPTLPAATAQAARAIFRIENVYLVIGDNLDRLVGDISFSEIDPSQIHRSPTLTRLALMTVFQFAEDLSDYQARSSLLERMDWKYALHLPIEHPRLDPTLLCWFREGLLGKAASLQAFETLLERLTGIGLLGRGKRGVQARTALEHVCSLHQLERLHEAVCEAIEALACQRPDDLRRLALPHWYDCYQGQRKGLQLRTAGRRESLRQMLGADTRHLLASVATDNSGVAEIPEVRRLASALRQQRPTEGTKPVWRPTGCDMCPWRPESCCELRELSHGEDS